MENTSQLMDVNVVDLGDDISSVSLAPGIGGSEIARGSTSLPTIPLANVDPESGAYEKSNGPRLLKFGMILNLL
jgi:hypothetical protein